MTTRNFKTDVGAALDMGTLTIASAELAGSTARLRIGTLGSAAFVELLSEEPPASPSTFSWTVGASSGALRIDLSQELLSPLTANPWPWVVHIILAGGQIVPIYDSSGGLDGRGLITMTAIPLAAAE